MTNEEAKMQIQAIPEKIWDQLSKPDREAMEMAFSALEKQIPKKPVVPIDTWLCPSCGEPVEYQQKLGDNVLYHGQYEICPKCGQRISWEEEDDESGSD